MIDPGAIQLVLLFLPAHVEDGRSPLHTWSISIHLVKEPTLVGLSRESTPARIVIVGSIPARLSVVELNCQLGLSSVTRKEVLFASYSSR